MITPIARNLLLEVLESDPVYNNGLIVPEKYRGISGKFKILAKAKDCLTEILVGTEVLLDYETADIKSNLQEIEGKTCFLIREDFVMCYFEED